MPEPALHPAVAEVVRETFKRQKFMALIGAVTGRVEAGYVEIELPFSEHIVQQSGVVHAGVLAAVADSACGGAALTLMPPGSDVVSIEFKLNLLAPAAGERFRARARVVRAGRTITVCSADVIVLPSESVVATMLGTMMRRGRETEPSILSKH